jgi:hypothetical protein
VYDEDVKLSYCAEIFVRPRIKRLLVFIFCLELGFFILLASSILFARFYWPSHPILLSPLSESIRGSLVLFAILLVPGVLEFANGQAMRWTANANGIRVYFRQSITSEIPWDEITDVIVLPYCIRIRKKIGKRKSAEMYWTDPSDGQRLREMWERNRATLPQLES